MPVAGGEELEHDIEGTAEIPESQATVILEIIGGWSVVTDLKLPECLHANNSIKIPAWVILSLILANVL